MFSLASKKIIKVKQKISMTEWTWIPRNWKKYFKRRVNTNIERNVIKVLQSYDNLYNIFEIITDDEKNKIDVINLLVRIPYI